MSKQTTGRQMLEALEKRVAELEREVERLKRQQAPTDAVSKQMITYMPADPDFMAGLEHLNSLRDRITFS